MAARQYDVNYYTARTCFRNHKAAGADVPLWDKEKEIPDGALLRAGYENMTRAELIDELIRARIDEEREKKGTRREELAPGRNLFP